MNNLLLQHHPLTTHAVIERQDTLESSCRNKLSGSPSIQLAKAILVISNSYSQNIMRWKSSFFQFKVIQPNYCLVKVILFLSNSYSQTTIRWKSSFFSSRSYSQIIVWWKSSFSLQAHTVKLLSAKSHHLGFRLTFLWYGKYKTNTNIQHCNTSLIASI